MGYTDPDSPAPKKNILHFKPIIPAPHSRGPALIRPSSILSNFSAPTPDPSPTMSPEDPKHQLRGDSEHSKTANAGRTSSKNSSGSQQYPTFSDLNKASATSSSSSPSSSRPLHTLYPNSTPPMSPGHALVSPVSRPHYGITDPSQYSSSSGFYQLPPPLQPFAPRQSPHHSPAIQPQSSQGHSLPSLPPLPSSAHSNGYSPRSTPQMSPLTNHYLISPALAPLSPYPTPQQYPRHFSSPHNDPLVPKQSIPAMVLPDSALSSGSSSQETHSRSYSTIMAQRDTEMSSPTCAPAADHSAPSSPRRYMMLPPQSVPNTATSHRSSRSQSRKASLSIGSSPTSAPTSPPARRRASASAKLVDQETRDLMRKVSHSAIERRRRERINDKILQLKHLVPACVDEDHLHKLSILQSTIEYIQHLKAILPASIANAKVGKATNNNPKNKTTDMLEAMGGSISTKSPLTPLMTTGLNHIYSKRIKVEKQEIRALLQDHSMNILSSSSDEDAKDGLLLLAGQSSIASIDDDDEDDDDDYEEDLKQSSRRKGSGSRRHE
ncbi:hypothetical protein BGX27_010016 [Mortierella sp. AM989]|nr:hypothetical protein BGX27_010016 [Mortierella sp. AM989]